MIMNPMILSPTGWRLHAMNGAEFNFTVVEVYPLNRPELRVTKESLQVSMQRLGPMRRGGHEGRGEHGENAVKGLEYVAIDPGIAKDPKIAIMAARLKKDRFWVAGHFPAFFGEVAMHAHDGKIGDIPDDLLDEWAGMRSVDEKTKSWSTPDARCSPSAFPRQPVPMHPASATHGAAR